jgi:rubredoxin
MARDHFLDLQQSGGEWWMEGWRCINCGHVFDPVVEQNRQLHAAAMASSIVTAQRDQPMAAVSQQELPFDIAA